MPDEDVKERFDRDVKDHEMTVIKDDGVYRHVRFKNANSTDMFFDLITWSGYLCYTGDMGSYLFTRIEDMFEFFRNRRINPHYWAEKCIACDSSDGVTEYSSEKAKEMLLGWFDEDDEEDVPEGIKEQVKEELIPHIDDERELREAVYDFRFNGEDYFPDFWEIDLSVYTYRFNWCCHALVWGIAKYDESKEAEVCK